MQLLESMSPIRTHGVASAAQEHLDAPIPIARVLLGQFLYRQVPCVGQTKSTRFSLVNARLSSEIRLLLGRRSDLPKLSAELTTHCVVNMVALHHHCG